jgi:hypothetical protein
VVAPTAAAGEDRETADLDRAGRPCSGIVTARSGNRSPTKRPARAAGKTATTGAAAPRRGAAARKPAAAPARSVARQSPAKGMDVDAYIETRTSGWQREVMRRLRALVLRAAPDASVAIKWGQPVFELDGPFAYARAARAHVTFGFWRGAELDDPGRLLAGTGDKMSHVKLTDPDGIDEPALAALVRQAVRKNREAGSPTKRR